MHFQVQWFLIKHIFQRVEEAGTTKPYFVPKFKPLQSQIRFLFFTQKIFCIFHFTRSLYEVVWLTRFLNVKAMKSSAEHSDGRAGLQLQPALPEPMATWAPASTGHCGHQAHLHYSQSWLQILPQEAPELLVLGREPQGSNAACLLFSQAFIAFTACLLLSLLGMALHMSTTQEKVEEDMREGRLMMINVCRDQ